MTPGNNGASPPEDDDPFGYLYADGQANGAQPPSGGGYGYPNSVSRVRAVGERQYGQQQTAPYQRPAAPPQQGAYGRPNPQHTGPENFATGGAGTTTGHREQGIGGGGGQRRGPNTKVLLVAALAVVAAVVVGIGVAMAGSGGDDDKADGAPTTPSAAATGSTPPSTSPSKDGDKPAELPKIDAKALRLEGGAVLASDVPGAKADGGVYVANFKQVGAALTWSVDGIPKAGKYTLFVDYGVPGKDGNGTLTINGAAEKRPISLKNFSNGPEGDYAKGWTNTWSNLTLNKGTNTIKISCEQGNVCDANIDRLWLEPGWK